MWVILQIDDLLMDRKIELSLAGKAQYDSNRSSHHNGRQEMYFLLSCMSAIALGKPLHGIDDARKQMFHFPTSQSVMKMEPFDQSGMVW